MRFNLLHCAALNPSRCTAELEIFERRTFPANCEATTPRLVCYAYEGAFLIDCKQFLMVAVQEEADLMKVLKGTSTVNLSFT